MSVLWATQALPTGVTGLLPVFLGPLLGIMSSAEISSLYMSVSANMEVLGVMSSADSSAPDILMTGGCRNEESVLLLKTMKPYSAYHIMKHVIMPCNNIMVNVPIICPLCFICQSDIIHIFSNVYCLSFQNTTLVLVGSIIVSLGIEESNLHRRIALSVLVLVGVKPMWYQILYL